MVARSKTPALHPQVRAFSEKRIALKLPPNNSVTPNEARKNSRIWRAAIPAYAEPVGRVVQHRIPGPATMLQIRLYYPFTAGPHPLLMLFHGVSKFPPLVSLVRLLYSQWLCAWT